jgi:uncharacterized protein
VADSDGAYEVADIEFDAEGATLRGWLYRLQAAGTAPVVVMAHGYNCLKEFYLDRYAAAIAAAGHAVLAYDHRNFGDSDGEPRQELDPWVQVRDYRNAITFAQTLEGIDPDRIGVWGSSYAGGHVLVVAAIDRRVGCVVSQVPTISGYQQGLRRVAPDAVAALDAMFNDDLRAEARGEPPRMQAIVSADRKTPAAYRGEDAIAFYLQPVSDEAHWENSVTLRSSRWARMYEPGAWVSRIGPKPLLMVLGTHDPLTLTDLGLEAYERAHEPKKLVMIPGEHFDPYLGGFPVSSQAAVGWFQQHLMT